MKSTPRPSSPPPLRSSVEQRPGDPGSEAEGAETPTTYTLHQFPETLAVVKLPPGAEIPTWAESSSIFSITATARETSVICAGRSVPAKVAAHRGYTAFAVDGTLDPRLVGVLHALLGPLVEANVSVFTLSTYETDWMLVPQQDADKAAEAWRRHGHTVTAAIPA